MAKLFLGAIVGRRARLGLVVAIAALCVPWASSAQMTRPFEGLSFSKKSAIPPAVPQVRSSLPPTLTIPAEPLGFSSPGAFYLGMRNSLVSLDFLDENRLLFTFRVPGLLRREANGAASDERKIRAVVLRLPQGIVEAETVWTVHDHARYLYMLGDGHFLLRDQSELKDGDASLQLKPYLRFPGPVLWVEMDPKREYLVTGSKEPPVVEAKPGEVGSPATAQARVDGGERSTDQPDLVLRVLRRDDGKVMLVSRVRSAVHLPINDEGYLELLRAHGEYWTVNFNYFTGGNAILGNVESVCLPIPNFISRKELLLSTCGPGGDAGLLAMATDGRRLWQDAKVGQAIWPLYVFGSNGLRLARETLVASHGVSASAPLGTDDIKGQAVEVFDAASGKVQLRAQASPILDAGGNVAISASGRRVAVLMEGGIQVFDLPPAPALDASPETEVSR